MANLIYRARYALILTAVGFGSALAITKNIEGFNALPDFAKTLLAVGMLAVGVFLIWKDRHSSDGG